MTKKNLLKSFWDGIFLSIPLLLIATLFKYILTLFPGYAFYGHKIIELDPIIFSVTGLIILLFYIPFGYIQEFLFRGVMLAGFESIFSLCESSRTKSVILTSLLFGLMHIHFTFMFAIITTFLGFYWSWIYLRTKNLVGVSISHAVVSLFPIAFLGFRQLVY